MSTFRADAEVMAAIEKIATTIDARGFAFRNIKSAVIRRAFLDMAARIGDSK